MANVLEKFIFQYLFLSLYKYAMNTLKYIGLI